MHPRDRSASSSGQIAVVPLPPPHPVVRTTRAPLRPLSDETGVGREEDGGGEQDPGGPGTRAKSSSRMGRGWTSWRSPISRQTLLIVSFNCVE